jgi:uncharacterized protein
VFLILHGLSGSGPGHWQRWLEHRLRDAGHEVRFPDLPDPDEPDLDAWLHALEQHRAPGGGEVVLAHSLGCVLWLHHRARGGPRAERALLVAPPSAASNVPEIQGFFPCPRSADDARFVAGDADPYRPEPAHDLYDGPLDLVPGGGHLNADAGYGPWPAVERWALYGANQGVEA